MKNLLIFILYLGCCYKININIYVDLDYLAGETIKGDYKSLS